MPRLLIEITPIDPDTSLRGVASVVVDIPHLDWNSRLVSALLLSGIVIESIGGEKP